MKTLKKISSIKKGGVEDEKDLTEQKTEVRKRVCEL